MPELPELEVVREVLERRVIGKMISAVAVLPPGGPIVVRDLTHAGFSEALTGAQLVAVTRRGKFLVFSVRATGGDLLLALNPKLAGRLQLAAPADKRTAGTHVVFSLEGGSQLRYVDQKKMGQLTLASDLALVPSYLEMGPEPLEVTSAEFRALLRPFRGEIKGVLTRGECVAGIGNAYADEILWAAGLHPFRKRPTLSPEEVDRLHAAMQATLLQAIRDVRDRMGENIHLKPRDFLRVHMRSGEPCPRCGTRISLVGANRRITNFCRSCQPGGLIKGM
jgi:formamidopyrimidine-DNA glycosylase